MVLEACATDLNRFAALPRAPVLLGELGESDRRRILLDPASEIIDARAVGHLSTYGVTVTCCVLVAVLPALSVTFSVIVYVAAIVYVCV